VKNRVVRRFKTGGAMASFAAGLFKRTLLHKSGGFTAALPGGATPARLFKELASLPLPWEQVVFFMSDERLVPASSPASNFGAARKALFSKIKVPSANLRPARTPAALEKEILKETKSSGRLDFVLLGLGADGHTASVFPGSPAEKSEKLALAVTAPRGVKPARRLTLTFRALNRARLVVLMAAGPAKKSVFKLAARGERTIPAGRLRPAGKFYLLFSEEP